jgi:tRNA nucleotidyltransferase (CCA-adding enzyme)
MLYYGEEMPEIINLSGQIKEQLPDELVDFIRKAGEIARERQQRLYLVGGAVRDILLERCNVDLDLVVEGDAVRLAGEIAPDIQGQVIPHSRFGTARLIWKERTADFATARAETYARPGALPTVKPGTIRDDLARRDFTINAMAIELNPNHYGELLDPFNGRLDVDKKVIRVLHDKSFIDDATRIWRAIRYEQRLDFKIESKTLALLRHDIGMLATVSGDRIRHELELVLAEELPEKALRRAGDLGVLQKLHPRLKADDWISETFTRAREQCDTDTVHPRFYLGLLAYRLTTSDIEEFIAYLHLPKETADILRDVTAVKEIIPQLAPPGLAPSQIYKLLHGRGLTALMSASLAAGSNTAAEHIELYINVLRHVNPALAGDDLIRLGVPQGPKVKDYLQRLRDARLDGMVNNKKEEEEMVREWVGE